MPTTIEVYFRPSRTAGAEGRVVYRVKKAGRRCSVASGVRLMPAQWAACCAQTPARTAAEQQARRAIEAGRRRLAALCAQMEREGQPFGAADVVARFARTEAEPSFTDYVQSQAAEQRALRHYGTARNYERALRSLQRFAGTAGVALAQVQPALIEAYHRHLVARGISRNSVSFYMRNLRAVYNKAVRAGLVAQAWPFAGVYTGVDRTAKRAVGEPVLRALLRLPLEGRPQLELTRDLFIFAYCARGMAFVDLAYLRHADLSGGFMRYARKKTGRRLVVRLEPLMQTIVERYRRTHSPYVFPILTATGAAEAYRQYVNSLNEHNRRLALLSMLLPGDCRLTSYVARHSWATIAQGHHVPVATISAALGHTTEQTTRIYLAQIESAEIDTANRQMLRALER